MVILGHYIKIGPHRSKTSTADRRILDCEGFFIVQKVRRAGNTQNSELLAPN
jgi:hypothetical protein